MKEYRKRSPRMVKRTERDADQSAAFIAMVLEYAKFYTHSGTLIA
jgi:hypothetical protein